MTDRNAVALQNGLDESMVAELDRLDAPDSSLSEQQRALLRVARTFVNFPGDFTGPVRVRALAACTEAEVVDVILFAALMSANKTTVVLGLDREAEPAVG